MVSLLEAKIAIQKYNLQTRKKKNRQLDSDTKCIIYAGDILEYNVE